MNDFIKNIKPYLKDTQNQLILGAGVFVFVCVIAGLYLHNRNPYSNIETLPDSFHTAEEADLEGWGKSFEPEPEPEVVEAEPELLEPPIAEPITPFRSLRERFRPTDLISTVDEEEEKRKRKLNYALHKYNASNPQTVFLTDESFMEAYKKQPLNQLRKSRERGDERTDFGSVNGFCGVLEDCNKSTKPTLLEYVIPRGTPIPVVASHDINSQIQSYTIQLQVTQDVVGFHGDNILLPKNSIATCENIPIDQPLQTRLAIYCKDFLTPNGVRIAVTGDAADKAGAEGVQGVVDYKISEQLKRAGLFSIVPVVSALSIDTESEGQANASREVTRLFTETGVQALSNIIDVEPEIFIEAGTQILIKPQENLVFKQPEDGSIIPTWGQ